MKGILIAINWLFCLSWSNLSNADCLQSCDQPQDCKREYFLGTKKIDFYSNFPLNQENACIEKVIIVVHGTERNAQGRYDATLDSAKTLGVQDRVLIISPFFKTPDDAPQSNDLYWSNSGWKQGNTSNNNGKQISSFAVSDALLTTVIDGGNFSNLVAATITGHSAGGQYSQMYALTTASVRVHESIDFQFLVLNPSNYTYLNTLRPHPYDFGYFESPVYWTGSSWKMKQLYRFVAGNCPSDYNNYKYGLEDRNSYASRFTSSELIAQYKERDVHYFLGELDTNEDDDNLDTSCPALLQGSSRLTRGKNYFEFLNQYVADHLHSFTVVAGIGHDGRKMYNSTAVKEVLFVW